MNEASVITDIKNILDVYLPSYAIKTISRKVTDVATMTITIAVIVKEGFVNQALITELYKYEYKNVDESFTFVETKLDLQNMDNEILLFQADIEYK